MESIQCDIYILYYRFDGTFAGDTYSTVRAIPKLGLLNSHLGLILIYTAFGLSTPILILYGFMMGLPKEMMEAAVMDGCSVHGVFWRMMIPVMQPALMTVAILSFVSIWNELLVALIFLSDLKKMTLPVGLLTFQGEYSTNFAPLFAAVVMATCQH